VLLNTSNASPPLSKPFRSRRAIPSRACFSRHASSDSWYSRSASATSSRGSRATSNGAAGKVNYATLEHAGEPHKGKITDTERQLVQEHFEEINDRLVNQGLRTISLADPDHVERYGLEDLAREQLGEQDALPIKELISERDEDFVAAEEDDEALAS